MHFSRNDLRSEVDRCFHTTRLTHLPTNFLRAQITFFLSPSDTMRLKHRDFVSKTHSSSRKTLIGTTKCLKMPRTTSPHEHSGMPDVRWRHGVGLDAICKSVTSQNAREGGPKKINKLNLRHRSTFSKINSD